MIWTLGWSMVCLAGLAFLPAWAVGTTGLLMIAGHNFLDRGQPAAWHLPAWLWTVLHQPGLLHPRPGIDFYVLYPLVPWIGVMAAGYALGSLLLRPPAVRRRWLVALGLGLILAFIVLRFSRTYGDPLPWFPWPGVRRWLSFINTEKYPPSLLFLLMTLGPALLALAWFDRAPGPASRVLAVYGRVPLFFYVLHLLLIHPWPVSW